MSNIFIKDIEFNYKSLARRQCCSLPCNYRSRLGVRSKFEPVNRWRSAQLNYQLRLKLTRSETSNRLELQLISSHLHRAYLYFPRQLIIISFSVLFSVQINFTFQIPLQFVKIVEIRRKNMEKFLKKLSQPLNHPPQGNLLRTIDNKTIRRRGVSIYLHTPSPWLTQIRFTRISLTNIFKKFPFLT